MGLGDPRDSQHLRAGFQMDSPRRSPPLGGANGLFRVGVARFGRAATAELSIGGMIRGGSAVLLDAATVKSFPSLSFACVDPWDGKEHKFTGALLSDILYKAGIDAAATRITVTAKNKYSIPIRRSDYEKYGYILAWMLDDDAFADDKATLHELADEFGVSAERIRQIEATALKKLKSAMA